MKKEFYTLTDYLKGKKPISDELHSYEFCEIDGETWLEQSAVLKLLHISDRTLRNWQRKKLIPYAKIGGRRYYPEAEIEARLRAAIS